MSGNEDVVEVILRELHAIDRTSRGLIGDLPLPGLTLTGASLLGLLAKRGDRRCGDIAEELGVDASAVSRRVAELERLGYVARRPDPRDGRAALLAATDAGRDALRTLRERYLTAVTRSLDTWDDADLGRLATALERLRTDLGAGRSERTIHLTGQEAYA